MYMVSIRGATTVEGDEKDEVLNKTTALLTRIIAENEIRKDDITSVLFTATKDISSVYPAVAARQLGLVTQSLMCVQEMYVAGSLKQCIRVSVTAYSTKYQKEVKHIYLEGAEILRPDLK